MSWQENPVPERDADFLFTWDEVDTSLSDLDEGLTNIDRLPQDHPLRAVYLELLDINMDGPVMLHDVETAWRRDEATEQFFRPELGRKSHFPNYQNIMKLGVVQQIVKSLVGFRTPAEAKDDGFAKLDTLSLSLDRANSIVSGSDFANSGKNRVPEDANEAEVNVITQAARGRGQAAFTDSSEYYEIYDFIDGLAEAIDQHEAEH